MKVRDAKRSIYTGLRALTEWQYLCAMWILCGELMSLYAESMSGEERVLMTSTLDLVRDITLSGGASVGARARAADLTRDWDRFTEEHENTALTGRLNAWATFEGLATAITGESSWYYASDWVAQAAAERWRDPYRRRPRVDPGEVVDDGNPMALTLDRFQQVVAGISRLGDDVADPAELRSQILGTG